jgi:Alpha-N-acetylglucosaminidase (NAGLU) tim-barrel domain
MSSWIRLRFSMGALGRCISSARLQVRVQGVYTRKSPSPPLILLFLVYLRVFEALNVLPELTCRYLTEIGKVDIYWTGSRLGELPQVLPPVGSNITRQAIVPWRYHFNTGTTHLRLAIDLVTFSYTCVWWGWDEWEQMLDWMALHGINLPLAW